MKHTYMSPESPEGQVILKDKFITQSAPDVRRKLQKLAFGQEQNLESLLKVITSVFYNRDEEERRDQDRRDNRKAEALAMALQRVNFGPPRLEKGRPAPGTGPGRPVSSVAERGILSESAPGAGAPNCQCPACSVKETTGSETALRGMGNWGWTCNKVVRTEGAWGYPCWLSPS